MKAALQKYRDASQAIYEVWRTGMEHAILPGFEMDHVPEPYLNYGFKNLDDSCVFLTTNPGRGMEHQLRLGVAKLSGGSVPWEYLPLSLEMASYYEKSAGLNSSARANVRRMIEIAKAIGRPGFLQVEMIPWHSGKLDNKDKVLSALSAHEPYRKYRSSLEDLLSSCPVVLSWSAGIPERRGGVGVRFKADAMQLDLASASLLEISSGTNGPSQGLFWQRKSGRLTALFVNQGSANLPANREMPGSGIKTYEAIAAAVRA